MITDTDGQIGGAYESHKEIGAVTGQENILSNEIYTLVLLV
jgi:hypothetical protein